MASNWSIQPSGERRRRNRDPDLDRWYREHVNLVNYPPPMARRRTLPRGYNSTVDPGTPLYSSLPPPVEEQQSQRAIVVDDEDDGMTEPSSQYDDSDEGDQIPMVASDQPVITVDDNEEPPDLEQLDAVEVAEMANNQDYMLFRPLYNALFKSGVFVKRYDGSVMFVPNVYRAIIRGEVPPTVPGAAELRKLYLKYTVQDGPMLASLVTRDERSIDGTWQQEFSMAIPAVTCYNLKVTLFFYILDCILKITPEYNEFEPMY